jgi:hypothetical protein
VHEEIKLAVGYKSVCVNLRTFYCVNGLNILTIIPGSPVSPPMSLKPFTQRGNIQFNLNMSLADNTVDVSRHSSVPVYRTTLCTVAIS